MARTSHRTLRRVELLVDVGLEVSDEELVGYLTKAIDGWSGQFDGDDPTRDIKLLSIESVRHANKPAPVEDVEDKSDPMCTCGVPLSGHHFFNSETLGPCSNFKRKVG